MRKILLITILSLSCMATFAAKSNTISNKLKKEKQAKMMPPVNLSYTTTCGTTHTFTIPSENMSAVWVLVDCYNDMDCDTHWLEDDLCSSAI